MGRSGLVNLLLGAIVAAVLLTLGAGALRAEKTLSWPRMDVRADLRADGSLHVIERQAMLLSGDWNGGERGFNIRQGQTLELIGINRIAGDKRIPLREGPLDAIDQWSRSEDNLFRWRSRMPADPPFENQTLTYELEYVLRSIIQGKEPLFGEGRWLELAHDFAFSDRPGSIDLFTLDLRLDPSWKVLEGDPLRAEVSRIPPGMTHPVKLKLAGGRAIDVAFPPSRGLRFLLLLFLTIAFVVSFFWLGLHERARGRFLPIDQGTIDAQWIESLLLRFKPEVIGAIWDEAVGAAEVAALLARMTHEKKIGSRVEQKKSLLDSEPVLHLQLLVDRNALTGYERSLIKAMFFDGDSTSTEAIATHYATAGFDPADKIRPGVQKLLAEIPDWKESKRKWFGPVFLPLVPLTLLTVAATANLQGDSDGLALALGTVVNVLAAPMLAGSAYVWSRSVKFLSIGFILAVIVALSFLGNMLLWALPITAGAVTLPTLLALTAGGLYGIWLLCWFGRSTQSRAKILLRKEFTVARDYFTDQLQSPTPKLKDSWYPYLLAFGLGENADRWFRSHGAASGSSPVHAGQNTSPGSGGGSSPIQWSGGGGAFGGAGASAGWAAAAGTMAAGVQPPASSSSGGSSSGGSSSGGGSGGGW